MAEVQLTAGDSGDIWLQAHSDDICLSLGVLAASRPGGTLLTAFPVSNHTAQGFGLEPQATAHVTALRVAEDDAFARACGLRLACLDHGEAVAPGQDAFNPAREALAVAEVEAGLMRVLLGAVLGRLPERRRWLFCPMGIGDHPEHLALLRVVLRHWPALRPHYRLGFHEDLPYAADATARQRGLARFAQALGGQPVQRWAWALDAAQQAAKLRLVELYASQVLPAWRHIGALTPAFAPDAPPHEAIWTTPEDRDAAG